MIIKTDNTNSKTTFLTSMEHRTPNKIWKDEEIEITETTEKDVIKHKEKLFRLGITTDQFEQNRHDVINEMKDILCAMEDYDLRMVDITKAEITRWIDLLHAKDLQYCK